jgi:hypothetical protein
MMLLSEYCYISIQVRGCLVSGADILLVISELTCALNRIRKFVMHLSERLVRFNNVCVRSEGRLMRYMGTISLILAVLILNLQVRAVDSLNWREPAR